MDLDIQAFELARCKLNLVPQPKRLFEKGRLR